MLLPRDQGGCRHGGNDHPPDVDMSVIRTDDR